jgi:hypothetical protein
MSKFFYRAEVKGIQSWILASNRLRELKGGSAIVAGLTHDAEVLASGTGGRIGAVAAGGVDILFEDESELARFAAIWPLIVAARAPGLPLVQAWGAADEPEKVYTKLGNERNRARVELPEAGPLLARAGRTGLPAVRRGRDKSGLEDQAVRHKLRAAEEAIDELAPEGWSFVEDADQLGERYLAVVHVDGNSVGKIVMALGADFEKKKRFSDALRDATRGAAQEAVNELTDWTRAAAETDPDDERVERLLCARPIVLGGDDFTILVDATHALPFTHRFLEAFKRLTKSDDIDPQGLTACAGIAIVKTSWPFHAANQLAEQLCKAAKERLRHEHGTDSGLLFHRVTTASSATTFEELCAGELRGVNGVLSGGPYTSESLSSLSDLTDAIAELPRGTLRGWVEQSRTSGHRADTLWNRAAEVANRKQWLAFCDALEKMDHDKTNGWGKERTAIPDALLWQNIQPDETNRIRKVTHG